MELNAPESISKLLMEEPSENLQNVTSKKLVSNTNESLTTKSDLWEDYTPPPPDGGWGWIIVVAGFFNNLVITGITHSFGLILIEYTEYFHSGVASVSLANSLLIGVLHIVGPVVGALVTKWGCRKVGVAGSLISAVSLIISTFSPSLIFFQLTYGVVGGVGLGMIYLSAIVGVGHYFDERRAIANGIAQCGCGMGVFAVAPVLKYLLNIMDWRSIHYLLAGFLLQCCVFFALMRPLTARRRTTPKFDDMEGADNSSVDLSSAAEKDKHSCLQPAATTNHRNTLASIGVLFASNYGSAFSLSHHEIKKACSSNSFTSERTQDQMLSCLKILPKPVADVLAGILDVQLLKNKSFIILCVANFFGLMAFFVPVQFVAARAVNQGVSAANAAMLISIFGITGSVSRILPGIFNVLIPQLTPLLWNNICVIGAGLSLLVTPLCISFASMAVATGIGSICASALISLVPVLICDLVGVEKLNNGFGLICMLRGIAVIIGPPLAGMLYDMTGSYDSTFYMGGCCYLMSAVFHCILLCKSFQRQQ